MQRINYCVFSCLLLDKIRYITNRIVFANRTGQRIKFQQYPQNYWSIKNQGLHTAGLRLASQNLLTTLIRGWLPHKRSEKDPKARITGACGHITGGIGAFGISVWVIVPKSNVWAQTSSEYSCVLAICIAIYVLWYFEYIFVCISRHVIQVQGCIQ